MLAKPERVAGTEPEALTNRGYDRDSSGQKDMLHSPRHLPVKVIDVLRGTWVFSVIVMSAHRQYGRNTQGRRSKMGESKSRVGQMSITRSSGVSEMEMNMPGAVTGPYSHQSNQGASNSGPDHGRNARTRGISRLEAWISGEKKGRWRTNDEIDMLCPVFLQIIQGVVCQLQRRVALPKTINFESSVADRKASDRMLSESVTGTMRNKNYESYELEWGSEVSGSLFFLLWPVPMACGRHCAPDSIERVRVQIGDVQKSALQLPWRLLITVVWVSLSPSIPGARLTTKKKNEKPG